MDHVDLFINEILEHGESRYDPVKAHEYYLRTRELQGRRSTSELKTTKQKEGWQYVKSEVGRERKEAFTAVSEANKVALMQLREKLQGRSKELQEKIRLIMEQITEGASSDRETITKRTQAKIKALPEIPKTGLTKEQRAKLVAERNEEIKKIRGDASSELEGLSEATTGARVSVRESGKSEREAIRAELKDTVEKARTAFKQAREAIKAKFEAELDTEFESIKAVKGKK